MRVRKAIRWLMISAAVVIAVQSVREIITPHHLPHWSTLVVLALVVVIKEGMARWVKRAGVEIESSSLQADAWHHRADALTSLAAFVATLTVTATASVVLLTDAAAQWRAPSPFESVMPAAEASTYCAAA